MRISDWSSDVCSSDLPAGVNLVDLGPATLNPVMEALLSTLSLLINLFRRAKADPCGKESFRVALARFLFKRRPPLYALRRYLFRRRPQAIISFRSEEHTSELQSLMRL